MKCPLYAHTVLGTRKIVMSKADNNLCLHEAYSLVYPNFLAMETEPRRVSYGKKIQFYVKCHRKPPVDLNKEMT